MVALRCQGSHRVFAVMHFVTLLAISIAAIVVHIVLLQSGWDHTSLHDVEAVGEAFESHHESNLKALTAYGGALPGRCDQIDDFTLALVPQQLVSRAQLSRIVPDATRAAFEAQFGTVVHANGTRVAAGQTVYPVVGSWPARASATLVDDTQDGTARAASIAAGIAAAQATPSDAVFSSPQSALSNGEPGCVVATQACCALL